MTTDYPIKRELSGIYFRNERNGKWINLDFTDMTEEEMTEKIAKMDMQYREGMIKALAKQFRSLGDELDLTRACPERACPEEENDN